MATTLKSKSRASGHNAKKGKSSASKSAMRPPAAPPGRAREKSPATALKAPVIMKAVVKPRPEPVSPYNKAIDFLMGHTDYERMRVVRYNTTTFNLDRMRLLLKYLGNPHLKFKTAHVAGTKGKGSTCTMLACMLQAGGYNVGLYTSPHLVDVRERIRVNAEMISPQDLVDYVKRVEPILKKMAEDRPTFFEIFTAISFAYFADKKVDIAVIETGLGGRLDSTNVITPEVTGITSISRDHMSVLGNTTSKIAEEKAGIFKKDVPAVTCQQDNDVANVLRRVAGNVKTNLQFVGSDIEFSYRFECARPIGPHMRVCLSTEQSRFEHLAVPLMGEHQAVNCGLALAMLDKLKARGFPFDDAKAVEGLAKLKLPGRLEVVSRDPHVIIDGAHNAASVQCLIRGIGQHIPYDSMVVVFGCNCDKDVDGMLEQISLGADKVIFTKARNNPKSSLPEELAAIYTERYGKMAQVAQTFTEAMSIAIRAISREDLITITGSFYLIGEAKQYFIDRAARQN